MRKILLPLIPCLLLAAAPEAAKSLKSAQAANQSPKAFPFPIHQKTLANGLKIVVIPTGLPNLVSIQIPVSTGSRNEVEPGKSGFAHFFEHMMFRGTKTVSKEAWNEALKETGASQNAFTSDDLTNYHTLCSKDDLEGWIKREGDRFQNLSYSEEGFKTESRAVLGEYNKNSSNPIQKLLEVQRDAAFTTHTYKHTTMGFLKDIEDMPNQFAYSRQFFDRWYRPENVTVILTGDVQPEKAFAMVEKYFSGWQRGTAKPPVIPAEPVHSKPVDVRLPWTSPTLPYMTVGFHTPAKFSTTENTSEALSLASELLFGSRSELYQRLVIREQKVDQLFAFGGSAKDPDLFTIGARVKKPEDLAYVRDLILDTCASARALPFSSAKLQDAKTEAHLAFARELDSTNSIAGIVARFTSYGRDPEAVNKLAVLRDSVSIRDLARIAKATFQDNSRVITTLVHGDFPANLDTSFQGVEARAALLMELPKLAVTEEPNAASPLMTMRAVFRVGSIHDPAGKEGLARLTASMIADASTKNRGLAELEKAYAATGSGLGALVDKELTSFSLTAPKIKAGEALDLAVEQLLEPGYKDEDFQRLKAQQLNGLNVGLKASNDEELGKLALESRMYAEPYAHPTLGTASGIQAITLADVKAFATTYYSKKRMSIGFAGSYSNEDKAAVLRGLNKLSDIDAPEVVLHEPEHLSDGSHMHIVTKETRSTAISIGIPLRERDVSGKPVDARVNRAHPDFAALWVATAYLGQHRNSTGVLYQRLREERGLNYGNYAYLEAFPNGGRQFQPSPGVVRTSNIWQVWIRPVDPKNGAFALKAALFEMNKLITHGMPEKEFQSTRTMLVKFLDHLNDTGSKKLGHDLDDAYLGLGAYAETFKAKLKTLSDDDVNQVIRKYLRTTNLDIAVVTKDADQFTKDLLADASPIPTYTAPKPQLKDEDQTISQFKVDVNPKNITQATLEETFR